MQKARLRCTRGITKALKDASGKYSTSPEEAEKLLTDYCVKVQAQAFTDTKKMLNKVRWYESYCSNTLKVAKNPETGEYTDEVKVYDPVELETDVSRYAY